MTTPFSAFVQNATNGCMTLTEYKGSRFLQNTVLLAITCSRITRLGRHPPFRTRRSNSTHSLQEKRQFRLPSHLVDLGPALLVGDAERRVVVQQALGDGGHRIVDDGVIQRRQAVRVFVVGRRAQVQQSLKCAARGNEARNPRSEGSSLSGPQGSNSL